MYKHFLAISFVHSFDLKGKTHFYFLCIQKYIHLLSIVLMHIINQLCQFFMKYASWKRSGLVGGYNHLSASHFSEYIWTDPFLINLNVSVQWYLSSRLHRLVNLADHRCTSPETTSTRQPGWLPMYPIKAMVLKGMNWQGFCAPVEGYIDPLT